MAANLLGVRDGAIELIVREAVGRRDLHRVEGPQPSPQTADQLAVESKHLNVAPSHVPADAQNAHALNVDGVAGEGRHEVSARRLEREVKVAVADGLTLASTP